MDRSTSKIIPLIVALISFVVACALTMSTIVPWLSVPHEWVTPVSIVLTIFVTGPFFCCVVWMFVVALFLVYILAYSVLNGR